MLLVDLRAGFTVFVDNDVDSYFLRTRWFSQSSKGQG